MRPRGEGQSSYSTPGKGQKQGSDPGHLTSASVLCRSHPLPPGHQDQACCLHNLTAQAGRGRLGGGGRRAGWGPLCPCLSLALLGPAPSGNGHARGHVRSSQAVFHPSRSDLFSMQCKFPRLRTWNLVQLCLDQCPTPFKFWRKLLLSKVQTCQTQ